MFALVLSIAVIYYLCFKINTYSLSLSQIWINDFDDITLHFNFSSDFLSNEMLSRSIVSRPVHFK